MADYRYKLIPTPQKVDSTYLNNIMNILARYPNESFVINFKNTKEFSLTDIRKIDGVSSNRVLIRVEGGYDQHRIDSYQATNYVNMHKYDNIYTIAEIKKILTEIEKIEKGINPNWSQEQKLMYFVGTLKNKIIYHPFHETAASKDIRSLRGLFSHNTVCAGYAVILKELCDRNGIECQYVEGACKKEDYDKGYLTHAWNIVKINGNYFPLDLTWNAGSNASGKTMSISDLANVNEFVKSHIPGKHEAIQDYRRTLKSIDGQYLTAMNNLVNKDMTYELSTLHITKKDGTKLHLSQVEEFVVDNKSVFKYVCIKEDNKGNISTPHIFYSTSNALNVVRGCKKKKKLQKELETAKRNGWTKDVERITKTLVGSEHLEVANDTLDNLLFSDANLRAAVKRGDSFIGGVKVERRDDKSTYVDGVYVDPLFGKKIAKNQRTFKRSDGTSFVIEEMGNLDIGNNKSVYRYKLFEYIKEDGKLVVKKNTIFTDQSLMYDNRQQLVDDFLSRSRLDRKARETYGYLGYYSKNNVRTYDPKSNEYFTKGLYRRYMMTSNAVKDYVPELTFNDMKRIVKIYGYEQVNGKWDVVNRRTKQVVTDPVLKEQIQFSLVWLRTAGIKAMPNDEVYGYYYAFEVEDAEKIFNTISALIVESINKTGNIDPVAIYQKVTEKHDMYKHTEAIVLRLFEHQQNINIVNKYFRARNPSALSEKTSIQPIFQNGMGWQQLNERRRQLEEEKKQLMEVIERNGQVEIVPARKR